MQKKEDVASIRLYPAPYVGGGDDLDDEDKGNQSQTHYYQSKWDDYVQESISKIQTSSKSITIFSFIGQASFTSPSLRSRIYECFGKQETRDLVDPIQSNGIESFFDTRKNILYLCLTSHKDWHCLAQSCRDANHFPEEDDFDDWMAKREHEYLKLLLFVFCVSNIVVHCSPSSDISLSLVETLRVLSGLKHRISSTLCNFLNKLYAEYHIQGVLSGSGRRQPSSIPFGYHPGNCVPYLLFFFDQVIQPNNQTEANFVGRSNFFYYILLSSLRFLYQIH